MYMIKPGVLLNPDEVAFVRQLDYRTTGGSELEITLRCGEVKVVQDMNVQGLFEATTTQANRVDLGLPERRASVGPR
jgi:hypothetical protein